MDASQRSRLSSQDDRARYAEAARQRVDRLTTSERADLNNRYLRAGQESNRASGL